jgi:ATP-dependent Lhr-like helicase
MSAFDLLHPSVQHHIVNSLGWTQLRPFQEEVIPVALRGEHILIIAPTAGGKTEAAILPILSRMLTEDWRGLSTLYICPIKALLNNLHDRLSRYASLLGRRCEVWHGDVSPGDRSRICQDPPDILLTTPESIEVMLVSTKVDPRGLLGQVKAVVVDELHAFAGDDRGWHLLGVLERVNRIADTSIQRIGLSATIGNPEELLGWLTCRRDEPQRVVCPEDSASKASEVQLDYVGSIANAALVISRLHRGEKRLVFLDSRARAEELATELRGLSVRTFITHSSLSRDQRTQAEVAFSSESDCVIVATSVLELGVDVGDLDRVVQIGAPSTVASFLQRMGRTGRRPGSNRNCLLLATDDLPLLQAAAILRLSSAGYVEPVNPPPEPHHVLAQQMFSLVRQESQLTRGDWEHWIGAAFNQPCGQSAISAIAEHALGNELLCEDNAVLMLGPAAERLYGRRNFMELLTVITSQPLFQIRYGRALLGSVHPLSFTGGRTRQVILALGGRSWRISHIEWGKKIAYVEPCSDRGRSRWVGTGLPLSPLLCAEMKLVLQGDQEDPAWSRRTRTKIAELRQELAPTLSEGTCVLEGRNGREWWTYAGMAVNQTAASLLGRCLDESIRADNLVIRLPDDCPLREIERAIADAAQCGEIDTSAWTERAEDLLKFSDLLPPDLLTRTIASRLLDIPGAHTLMNLPVAVR